jgi:hypothetical protein
MSDDRITTESVALTAVETDPIVLRESEDGTRRLVFKAMIVDRPEAPVRGIFVYQRRRPTDEWEDITAETLNSLKSGEGYALQLRSGEVSKLLQGIQDRRGIYEKHGIQFGQQDYFGGANLPEVVRRILEEPESDLARALQALDPESLLSLGRSVDLSKLDALLDEWDANEGNSDEDFWQDLLTRNAWVFSQLTGSPVVLLKERAYVGGKGISNTGGGDGRLPARERVDRERLAGGDQDSGRRSSGRAVPIERRLPAGQGRGRRGGASARLPGHVCEPDSDAPRAV